MIENERDLKSKKINTLQTVRTMAFIGIFLYHAEVLPSSWGPWGVCVFFSLSGFLMLYTNWNKDLSCSPVQALKFAIKKISKLYLLHVIMAVFAMILNLAIMIYQNHLKSELGKVFFQIICNLLLIQSWIPDSTIYYSLNSLSWYLSAAFFLYFTFPYILRIIKRMHKCGGGQGIKRILIMSIAIYAIQVALTILTRDMNALDAGGHSFREWFTYNFPLFRLGDFAIGCNFGYLFLNHKTNIKQSMATVYEVLILTVTIFLSCIPLEQFNMIGVVFLPEAMVLIYLFAFEKGLLSRLFTNRISLYIAKKSPYAYLIHQIVLRILIYVGIVMERLMGFGLNIYFRAIIAFIFTLILPQVYIIIEKKISGLKARFDLDGDIF